MPRIDLNKREGESRRLDYERINRAALACFSTILARWLPDGSLIGHEWIARNPRRADKRPGSFSVNVNTGVWADFASSDKGGDPISLAAYLAGCSQSEAARQLGQMLGIL